MNDLNTIKYNRIRDEFKKSISDRFGPSYYVSVIVDYNYHALCSYIRTRRVIELYHEYIMSQHENFGLGLDKEDVKNIIVDLFCENLHIDRNTLIIITG